MEFNELYYTEINNIIAKKGDELKKSPPIVSSAHILGAEWYNKYVDDFLAYWCCAKERRNFTSSARYNPKYIKISENAT